MQKKKGGNIKRKEERTKMKKYIEIYRGVVGEIGIYTNRKERVKGEKNTQTLHSSIIKNNKIGFRLKIDTHV